MNIDPRISLDFAQIGGVRLHYARAGEGRRLVILLHGFPECWYSWRHQLAALADDYTVVAPDMRGYNLSDKPRGVGEYRMSKLVDDVIGLIHHFGREQAAIVGHDWGAAVAWSLAERYPNYVGKLAALQVPPASVWRRNLTFRQLAASWYMFFFQLPWLPEYLLSRDDFAALKESLKRSTFRKGVFSDADIEVYARGWREEGALTSMINYYRANVLRRFTRAADGPKRIAVPTLFVYGEHDMAILRETVRGIGDVVDAPFEEFFIPDSGHWVQQEAPETVTQMLREFLAQ
ncbi:MAG: alpha/beta fold hydrolase [Pyrinomonadaceae bacterium]